MLLWIKYDDQPYLFEPCRRIPAITAVDDSSSNSNNSKSNNRLLRLDSLLTGWSWSIPLKNIHAWKFLYTFCVLCFKHRLIHRIVNCKFLRVYFFFNNWFVNKLQKFKPTKCKVIQGMCLWTKCHFYFLFTQKQFWLSIAKWMRVLWIVFVRQGWFAWEIYHTIVSRADYK